MAEITKKRRLKGIVISDKMMKTVVVRVNRTKKHPKYHKRFVISSKFMAENPDNTFHTGDAVVIEETRPMSARKRWKVISRA